MFDFLGDVPTTGLIAFFGVGLGLVLFTILSQVEEKAALRSTLRQLDDYEVENVRDQELLIPLRERVIGPAVDLLGRFGGRFNPPDYVESVRRKHVQAGINSPDKVERFLAQRLLGFVFIPIWLMTQFIWNPLNQSGLLFWALTGFGALIGALGPTSQRNKKVEARQKAIQRALPEVMDLLVISVEAGLGFEQALDRVIVNVPGELSNEFSRVLGESRAGSSRADALRAMDKRCDTAEVRSFVMAMIQADTFGVSIGRVFARRPTNCVSSVVSVRRNRRRRRQSR